MKAAEQRIGKVISGGQTGVDRAALDSALALGIPYGGWCPKGGLAEDVGKAPGLLLMYPHLGQTPSADPAERTEWNVRDSDATLIISPGPDLSPGTRLTGEFAERLRRPLLTVAPDSDEDLERVRAFIQGLPEGTRLNIAGPRESEAPGIYAESRQLIERILSPETW